MKWTNLISLLEFYIVYSEVLLAACADQLLNNLRLIKLCLAYAKQNAAVMTVGDAFPLLVK